MGIAMGCELLERGLGDLASQIEAVRESVSSVSRTGGAGGSDQLQESFASAASYIACTLTDVSDRLKRLDEVLVHFRGA
jgi:hypothetical protein